MNTSPGHSTATPTNTINMQDRSARSKPNAARIPATGGTSLLVWVALSLLSACYRPPAATNEAPAAEAASANADAGVALKPEEIEKMGIVTTAAIATTFAPEAAGYGVVLAHDVIAQAVADVEAAVAATRQSRSALARMQNLAGTLGAFSAETLETTERQAAADQAALRLAQRKLSATFGERQPWQGNDGSALLNAVANGKTKLLRATFPLGTLGTLPRSLRISRPDPTGSGESWKTNTVWPAPADATIPGRSLFALLEDSDAGEGERLEVWAAAGAAESGVLVPQAAVIISEGKYWCYVEKQPGTFVRRAIDASSAVAGGYFVREGIAAGEPVVTAAAGLLLARETNPSTETE